MSWSRPLVAAALVEMLTTATGGLVTVFDRPPPTFNPPAIVVARVESVSYGTAAMGRDEVTLPIVCVGAVDGDEDLDDMRAVVKAAIDDDVTLLGSVQAGWAVEERNWRQLSIAGGDVLAVDLMLTIQA